MRNTGCMRRRLFTALLLTTLLLLAPAAAAQDSEMTAEPDTSPQVADDLLNEMREIAGRVEVAEERAFNLLGLFEAFGIVITIVAGVAGFFGFTRLISAQNELTAARERVENELADFRSQVRESIDQREEQLTTLVNELRDDLRRNAEAERQSTSNALLANALIPLGERQYRAADYQGALNTYNRALELDPNNPVVHQRLGYVYTQSGELEQAEYHYKKAMEKEPDFAPALAGLGFVYRRQAEKIEDDVDRALMLNEAEELLLQALKISPKLVDDDGESWWGVLGGLYRRRGQIDDAIEAYKKATVVRPQSSYGFGNLALLYMKKQNREEMLRTYERVERIAATEAEQEQGNFWGYADLIVARYALGKWQEAEAVLPTALSIVPADSPYMLEGLQDTLSELVEVVEEEKRPPIRRAIESIQSYRDQRAQEAAAEPQPEEATTATE